MGFLIMHISLVAANTMTIEDRSTTYLEGKTDKNKLCSIIGRTRSSPMTRSSHTITEMSVSLRDFQPGRVP
ncbi:hypothetical protein OROMI_008232 [Orobanche minor]